MKMGSAVDWLSSHSSNYQRQFNAGSDDYSVTITRMDRAKNNHYIIWLLLLIISITLVCLPRFNRNDFFIQKFVGAGPSDAGQYILLTQYFRGQDVEEFLEAPFTFRPLVPFLASLLPFDVMTSINIINMMALILAVVFLYKILTLFGINFNLSVIGCGLFVFSFPVFYYGTIQYVDPVLISFVMAGTYYILSRKFFALTTVIVFGALVKETIIILLPVFIAHQVMIKERFRYQVLHVFLLFMSYAITIKIARILSVDHRLYVWTPSLDRIIFNVLRPRNWLSFFLSLGIPGLLSCLILWNARKKQFREDLLMLGPLVVGFVMVLVLFGYSMTSAASDGRFIWPSYTFTIPICIIMYSRFKDKGIIQSECNTLKNVVKILTPALIH